MVIPFFWEGLRHPAPNSLSQKREKKHPKRTDMTENSFMNETLKFIAAATWLRDEDGPAIISLLAMADELDKKLNPPLVAQYGLTYRNLLKRKPEEGDDLDELGRLLKR